MPDTYTVTTAMIRYQIRGNPRSYEMRREGTNPFKHTQKTLKIWVHAESGNRLIDSPHAPCGPPYHSCVITTNMILSALVSSVEKIMSDRRIRHPHPHYPYPPKSHLPHQSPPIPHHPPVTSWTALPTGALHPDHLVRRRPFHRKPDAWERAQVRRGGPGWCQDRPHRLGSILPRLPITSYYSQCFLPSVSRRLKHTPRHTLPRSPSGSRVVQPV